MPRKGLAFWGEETIEAYLSDLDGISKLDLKKKLDRVWRFHFGREDSISAPTAVDSSSPAFIIYINRITISSRDNIVATA